MSDNDDQDEGATVIAMRGSDGQPIVIPQEIAYVAETPYRCWLLHQRGMTWQNIAEVEKIISPETHKPSGRMVRSMVETYLEEGAAAITDFSRKHLMMTQMARYERIIAVHYAEMEKGSIASAGIVMNAMREENRLTRLDQPVLDSGEDGATHGRTVVINDEGKGYSASLEQASRKAQ